MCLFDIIKCECADPAITLQVAEFAEWRLMYESFVMCNRI